MKNGVSAAFSYCASKISSMYETYFYFSEATLKVESGIYLHVSKKGVAPQKVDLPYKPSVTDIIYIQFDEFIKLLKGEKSDIVSAEEGRAVISVIEEIYKQNGR